MKRGYLWVGGFAALILAGGALGLTQCAATGHPVVNSPLGTVSRSTNMLRDLTTPGPLELETVVSANWAVARSQILNLDHPRAQAAGLKEGDEAIQVYFHVVRHPDRGTFLVDTGVEDALGVARDRAAFRGFIADFMRMDQLELVHPLGSWLREHPGGLAGVFFTHLHLDHVTGLPDVPKDTPLYAGPTEAHHGALLNVFGRGGMDRAFDGRPPLQEWIFQPDPDGRFEGVVDVFGDGSLFALYVPGHTCGSTAYLARTRAGPVLITGDPASTVWGWENQVEPGSFTADHAADAASLAKLRRLAEAFPTMDVRLGHQALRGPQAP